MVVIIKSATRLAFAASCLTAIVTLPMAHAQMGAPGAYGYGPPPGVYGYGPHQAPMAMAPRQALMRRRASTSRHRLPQARREPS